MGVRAVFGVALLARVAAADPDPFEVREIPVAGRTAAAEIADLDGDGTSDVFLITVKGMPPAETRRLRVHFGESGGAIADEPSWQAPLREGAATYDVGDVDGRPGVELVLLHRDGLAVLSFAGRTASVRELRAPFSPTAGAVQDERGIDRMRILRPELGPKRLVVPGFGEVAVLDASGAVRGRMRVGARANYFIPPRPGPMISENEFELYFDVPRIGAGDVDGDGRGDFVSATRHAIRVFRQRADGSFPTEPDAEMALGLLSAEDHVRNAGSAQVALDDIDGDGRADLLVCSASGGLLDAVTQTRIHLNRGGTWDLAEPDQIFEDRGGAGTGQLLDLDGDGRLELVRVFVPVSLLEFAEVFLQSAVDARARIHRLSDDGDDDGPYAERAWFERKYGVGFSFETMRPRGFVPTVGEDLNADGFADLLNSGDGEHIEVYLGDPDDGFGTRHARQSLDTAGRVRFGDLDGDGLTDWILYDPRRPDVPVRLGRNRGVLPGSPAGIRADSAP